MTLNQRGKDTRDGGVQTVCQVLCPVAPVSICDGRPMQHVDIDILRYLELQFHSADSIVYKNTIAASCLAFHTMLLDNRNRVSNGHFRVQLGAKNARSKATCLHSNGLSRPLIAVLSLFWSLLQL